jgi:hypothetical protein
MRLIFTILCAVFICAGCVSKPRAAEPSEPVAGLKRANLRAAYTSEQVMQLYLRNIGFGDWYLARLAAACDVLAHDATTADARYEALRLKANQAASVYSILTNPNPTVQALSLQVLVELTRLKWISEGTATAMFGDRGKLLIEALDEMEKRGRANALGMISENELNLIAASAQKWRSENRQISDIELIRFEDFATELAQSFAQQEHTDLMSSLQSAASGLEDTRLLGVRALYLMSRFPRIMQWQLEAQAGDVARRPETTTFLDDVSRMTRTAEELKQQTAKLQGTLDTFPQKLANSLTVAPVVKEALSTANVAILRGEAATTQLAGVEAAFRRLDDSVASLSQQLERLNRSYDPVAVEKMAIEGKLVVMHEARSLIFLITCCVAGMVVLHAVLRRRRHRRLNVKLTPTA